MSILLDTHVFLWAAGIGGRLTSDAKKHLLDPNEKVFFSAASAWEIAIKWSKGRLTLPADPTEFINSIISVSGMSRLSISMTEACAVAKLPFHHKDPFDRLLVAQAQANDLRLMTADAIMGQYDVEVIALRPVGKR